MVLRLNVGHELVSGQHFRNFLQFDVARPIVQVDRKQSEPNDVREVQVVSMVTNWMIAAMDAAKGDRVRCKTV